MLKQRIPQLFTLILVNRLKSTFPNRYKKEILIASYLTFRILLRAEDGTQTRDPQLGRLMLYQLSYFRNFSGQRWIRTTEGVSQQIYSLPHLATLVFAHRSAIF